MTPESYSKARFAKDTHSMSRSQRLSRTLLSPYVTKETFPNCLPRDEPPPPQFQHPRASGGGRPSPARDRGVLALSASCSSTLTATQGPTRAAGCELRLQRLRQRPAPPSSSDGTRSSAAQRSGRRSQRSEISPSPVESVVQD